MFELVAVAGIGVLSVRRIASIIKNNEGHSSRTVERLERLWQLAQLAMRERKYIPAEKALLTILKIDHKNAPAYNRLGILYAKQQSFDDAIECFEIASSIDRKPSSLHNLGLIYFETQQYEKAVVAFEKALGVEPLAVRYIALAKAQQKLGHFDDMVDALEQAAELEPNPQTYKLLAEGYALAGRTAEAQRAERHVKSMALEPEPAKRIRRPRRVQ